MRLPHKSLRFVPQSVDFICMISANKISTARRSLHAILTYGTALECILFLYLCLRPELLLGSAHQRAHSVSKLLYRSWVRSALASCVALFAPSMCVRAAFWHLCWWLVRGRQGSRQSCYFTCYSQLWAFHDAVFECVSLRFYAGLHCNFCMPAANCGIFSVHKLAR